jgi:hypothetical protein
MVTPIWADNMVFTHGRCEITFAFWQRAAALVQFPVTQESFASFSAVT